MSSSMLKVKGHQRFRVSTPYGRPSGLVGRVREWLSPSSWTSYFQTESDIRNHDSSSQVPPSQASQVAIQRTTGSLFGQRPLKSEALASKNLLVCTEDDSRNSPVRSPVGSSIYRGKHSLTATTSSLGSRMVAIQRETFSETSQNSSDGSALSSSERSWVAEADDDDLCIDYLNRVPEASSFNGADTSWIAEDDSDVGGSRPYPRPVSISLAREELRDLAHKVVPSTPSSPFEYVIGEGQPGVAQNSTFLLTPGAEVAVQHVVNPGFTSQSASSAHPSPIKGRPTATPVTFSYPSASSTLHPAPSQPSEKKQEVIQVGPPTIHLSSELANNSSKNVQSKTRPTPFLTPSNLDTDESIRRSPFTSPFYSGRTTYGGAASGQKPRVKRPRVESDPPSSVPQWVTVHPSKATHSETPGISETAKRILSSLQSSNSPLVDARKMPMRNIPVDEQPTKRRRVSDGMSNSIFTSPPPVTPLHQAAAASHVTPYSSSHQTPLTLRPQKPSPEANTTTTTTTPSLPPRGSTTSTETSRASPLISLKNISGTITPGGAKQSDILSGLKFTPAPITQEIPSKREKSPGSLDHEESPSQSPSRKKRSSQRVSGKIRANKRTQQHFSRKSAKEVEEVDTFVNSMAPPPPVGLTLGSNKTLSGIKFHTQPISSTAPFAPTTSSQASLSTLNTSQDFSFSSPITVTDHDSGMEQSKEVSVSSFGFTVPKSHTLTTASISKMSPLNATLQTKTPASATSLGEGSLSAPVVLLKNAHAPKQPLPLKSASIEDVFSTNVPTKKVTPTSVKNKGKDPPSEVIDLTGDTSDTTSKPSSTLKPLPQFAPPAGSWSCEVCCVSNKPDSSKCVACQTPKPSSSQLPVLKPLPQFAPPAGSWSCEVCYVSNKPDSSKCVACQRPKPSQSTAKLAVSGTLSLLTKPAVSPSVSVTTPTISSNTTILSSTSVLVTSAISFSTSDSVISPTISSSAVSGIPSSDSASISSGMLSGGITTKPDIALKARLAPPTGSWECEVCMVSNKKEDSKCVACSTPKPGSLPVTKSSGGFKLGTGISLGKMEMANKPVSKVGEIKFGESGGMKIGCGLNLGGVGLKIGQKITPSAGTSGGLKISTNLTFGSDQKLGSGIGNLGEVQVSKDSSISEATIPERGLQSSGGIKFTESVPLGNSEIKIGNGNTSKISTFDTPNLNGNGNPFQVSMGKQPPATAVSTPSTTSAVKPGSVTISSHGTGLGQANLGQGGQTSSLGQNVNSGQAIVGQNGQSVGPGQVSGSSGLKFGQEGLFQGQNIGLGQSTGLGQNKSLGHSTGLGQSSSLGQSGQTTIKLSTGLGQATGLLGQGQLTGPGQSTGLGKATGLGQSTGSGQATGLGQSTGPGLAIGLGLGQATSLGQSTGLGQAPATGLGQSTGLGQAPATGLGQSTGLGQASTTGLGQSTGLGQAPAMGLGQSTILGQATGLGQNANSGQGIVLGQNAQLGGGLGQSTGLQLQNVGQGAMTGGFKFGGSLAVSQLTESKQPASTGLFAFSANPSTSSAGLTLGGGSTSLNTTSAFVFSAGKPTNNQPLSSTSVSAPVPFPGSGGSGTNSMSGGFSFKIPSTNTTNLFKFGETSTTAPAFQFSGGTSSQTTNPTNFSMTNTFGGVGGSLGMAVGSGLNRTMEGASLGTVTYTSGQTFGSNSVFSSQTVSSSGQTFGSNSVFSSSGQTFGSNSVFNSQSQALGGSLNTGVGGNSQLMPTLNFGNPNTNSVATKDNNQGYNFSGATKPNLNFGNIGSQSHVFSGNEADNISNRVIKKATRRKKQ